MIKSCVSTKLSCLFIVAGCAFGGPGEEVAERSEAVSARELDPAEHCDPALGGFSLQDTNAFFPIGVGWQWNLEGEEDDELITLQITMLEDTEVVAGVTTRVLEEREWEGEDLVEVSRNFVAERNGTICYFGEDVDDYEDGEIVGHEGAWRADEPGNAPGILMPADPRPGDRFPTEVAPGIAEDEVKIVGSGPVEVDAGTFTDNVRFREYNPLDEEKGYKTFSRDVGIVVDEVLELVSFTSP